MDPLLLNGQINAVMQFDTSKDRAVVCAHSLHVSKVITIEGCFPCMGASLSVATPVASSHVF